MTHETVKKVVVIYHGSYDNNTVYCRNSAAGSLWVSQIVLQMEPCYFPPETSGILFHKTINQPLQRTQQLMLLNAQPESAVIVVPSP